MSKSGRLQLILGSLGIFLLGVGLYGATLRFPLIYDSLLHIRITKELTERGDVVRRAFDAIVDRVQRRMAVERRGKPSKPDDMSLILFRKPLRDDRRV